MISSTLSSGWKSSFISSRLVENDESATSKAYALYLTGRCNLSCPYCCKARDMPGMPEMPLRVVESFVEMVKETRCTISVLGGEPTLHREFNQVLELLLETDHEEIIVLSNGTVPITPVDGITYYLTLHSAVGASRNLDTIDTLSASHQDRKYRNFISNCRKIDPSHLIIELTEPSAEIQAEFPQSARELWIDAKPTRVFAENVHSPFYYLNGIKISAEQVLKLGLNRFRGWKCLVHDFDVFGDGTVRPVCTSRKIPFPDFDPTLDYVITCTQSKCTPECMLESIKFKPL